MRAICFRTIRPAMVSETILVLYRQVRRRRAFWVERKVVRRGTCDRGIWTKSLAFAADAEELILLYGFSISMGFQWPFRHLIAS
jgi:hypothetical protein